MSAEKRAVARAALDALRRWLHPHEALLAVLAARSGNRLEFSADEVAAIAGREHEARISVEDDGSIRFSIRDHDQATCPGCSAHAARVAERAAKHGN